MEKGICHLKFLNDRIKNFKYGKINKKDKPSPNITAEQIRNQKNTRLQQNGIQMHILIRVLPFLVLDLLYGFIVGNASASDKRKAENIVHFLTIHLETIQLVSSTCILPGHLDQLDELIKEHNTLYQQIFGLPLINKFHFLKHYVAMIIFYGPAVFLETTRFEALHKLFKDRMVVCNSFLNVPLIISRHYAFWFTYHINYEVEQPLFNAHACKSRDDPVLGTVVEGDYLEFNGVEYQQGMVLCISTEDVPIGGYPKFGKIHSIAYHHENIYFKVQVLTTNIYSSAHASYHVILNNEYIEVQLEMLPSVYPLALWRTFKAIPQYYISMKTVEFL